MSQFQTSTVRNMKLDLDHETGMGEIRFIRLADGITLMRMNCKLRAPVTMKFSPPFESVCFSYHLSGRLEARPDKGKTLFALKPGQNDLKWCPGFEELTETLVPGHLVRVSISMNREVLSDIAGRYRRVLPTELQNPTDSMAYCKGPMTPQMRAAVGRLLQCPYHGLSRDLFIEGKILELLAYEFQQLDESDSCGKSGPIEKDDLERVHHAAHLMIQNFENPPTLGQLAGSVGMCRTRLYEYFRRVHGVTPLDYLRRHRLEKAMNYLMEGRMNVTEAAFAVGYSSSGYFTKNFKKYFGDLPKNYCRKPSAGE